MAKPTSKLPLDALSSIVMVTNMGEGDLVEVFGPFGGSFRSLQDGDATILVWMSCSKPTHRLYCRDHLLLMNQRKLSQAYKHDKSLDAFQQMLAQGRVEEMVRQGELKVFGVRRPSTKTWDQCPHCRWKERNGERLRQSYG